MKRDEAIFKENLMTFFITYTPKGRLGNNIFQYLTCKLLEILWKNHIYIDYFSISPNKGPIVQFTDEDFNALIAGKLDNTRFEEVNIMCDGFFQKSVQFVKHREMLLSLTQSDDCFIHKLSDYRGVVKENCNAQPFKTLFNTPSPYSFRNRNKTLLHDIYFNLQYTYDVIYAAIIHGQKQHKKPPLHSCGRMRCKTALPRDYILASDRETKNARYDGV